MDAWGLLHAFTNLNEISANETKMNEARISLQLENAALQSSTDVNLDGDFALDNFIFDYKFDLDSSDSDGKFLSASESDGTVHLKELSLPSWVYEYDQHQLSVNTFLNDASYVGIKDDVLRFSMNVNLKSNDFIYTGDLMNLLNRPTFEQIKSVYGYSDGFCERNLDLRDLLNKSDSRMNIDLGDVCIQNNDYVYFDTLKVIDSIHLDSYMENGTFLFIHENRLSNRTYDFPYLLTKVPEHNANVHNSLPSLTLFSNLCDIASRDIDATAMYNRSFLNSNSTNIKKLIYDETLFTSDNLLSHTTDTQKLVARQNMSLGTISVQSSNDVQIQSIQIYGKLSVERSNQVFFDNKWMSFEHFKQENVYNSPSFASADSLFTLQRSSQISNVLDAQLSNLHTNANLSLEDLAVNLVDIKHNLSDLPDLLQARSVLKLSPVAVFGRLEDLSLGPKYLSELENDFGYYERNNNLADIHPLFREAARQNIGVSNMALEDADNIGGTEFLPLGVANKKFHSTDCVIDTAFADIGNFTLKSLDPVSEAGHDFLCVQKFDKIITGIKNFKYRYKKIDKCDEAYFTGPFLHDPTQNVRVKINDLTDVILLDAIGSRVTDYIVAEYFVPSCKFSYIKFTSIAKKILKELDIPHEYFEGGLDNIELFNRQF